MALIRRSPEENRLNTHTFLATSIGLIIGALFIIWMFSYFQVEVSQWN